MDAYGGFDPETGKEINGLKALADDLGQGAEHAGRPAPALRADAHATTSCKTKRPTTRWAASCSTCRQGTNVVLEFGRYGSDLERIHPGRQLPDAAHPRQLRRTQRKRRLGDAARSRRRWSSPSRRRTSSSIRPSPADTIFGTIARELRKYNVTLLIVDQRPSGIDAEVMSQIGTRVTLLLDNPNDIRRSSRASAARAGCARCWPGSTPSSRR